MTRNTRLRDLMEELVGEMVERGIYWNEAEAQFEKQFIQKSLLKNGGNLIKTSASMGIHRNTLSKKITQHKIPKAR
ncbi:MAG TPA: helix-turn-helix domain-containing protein [Acidobacteriota bacterium]|jgi:DNA-binding NtrC family response regulator